MTQTPCARTTLLSVFWVQLWTPCPALFIPKQLWLVWIHAQRWTGLQRSCQNPDTPKSVQLSVYTRGASCLHLTGLGTTKKRNFSAYTHLRFFQSAERSSRATYTTAYVSKRYCDTLCQLGWCSIVLILWLFFDLDTYNSSRYLDECVIYCI